MTLQEQIGKVNEENGWHARYAGLLDDGAKRDHLAAKLALIISEATEALEELRSGSDPDEVYYEEVIFSAKDGRPVDKPEGFPTELADIVIRTYDLAYMLGIDLDSVIAEKLEFNSHRGVRHDGKHL